jgi:hypothetical protein
VDLSAHDRQVQLEGRGGGALGCDTCGGFFLIRETAGHRSVHNCLHHGRARQARR